MRKIKANCRIEHCVHIGEVIKYCQDDGSCHELVAVNKPKSEGCSGCFFCGKDCGVWFNDSLITICHTYAYKHRIDRFCKFVRVEDLLEDL